MMMIIKSRIRIVSLSSLCVHRHRFIIGMCFSFIVMKMREPKGNSRLNPSNMYIIVAFIQMQNQEKFELVISF